MRRTFPGLLSLVAPAMLAAQAFGHFPPDSLVNVKVLPRTLPVVQVIGQMRNFAGDLGVRCQFCHVGQEGLPLDQFDFSADTKRTKLVARQMMLMVQEINHRLDSLPERAANGLQVTCATCHRGVSRPAPLSTVLVEIGSASGADSAVRAYRALRSRYHGRAAYDFGEGSLNTAAFRLARAGKFEEAFAILRLNAEQYPLSSGMEVFRGNIHLMRGDSTSAEAAYREAVRRDSTNDEAKGRLRAIGKQP